MITPTTYFKSLSDETRLKCVLLIQAEGELCVCELMTALDEIQPKISRHLAKLRQNGLLIDTRRGQWVFYSVNPQLPSWAHRVLDETLEQNKGFITQELENLTKMSGRPDRASMCC